VSCESTYVAVSCAKMAELIEMPFAYGLGGPKEALLDRVDISATWQIRLRRPCAAVMRPYVKLL